MKTKNIAWYLGSMLDTVRKTCRCRVRTFLTYATPDLRQDSDKRTKSTIRYYEINFVGAEIYYVSPSNHVFFSLGVASETSSNPTLSSRKGSSDASFASCLWARQRIVAMEIG